MLKNLIVEHGTSNWTKVGESFPERTGKQCRERWYNHLDPSVKKGEWTIEVKDQIYRDLYQMQLELTSINYVYQQEDIILQNKLLQEDKP